MDFMSCVIKELLFYTISVASWCSFYQKQPFTRDLLKCRSEEIRKINRTTLPMELFFTKVAGFFSLRPQHTCFPTTFMKNFITGVL